MPESDVSYSTSELEAALRMAFVNHRAPGIVIDSRHMVFQIASANYGVERGWLKGEWDECDEQCTVWIGRLTEAGRKHFGLEEKHASK